MECDTLEELADAAVQYFNSRTHVECDIGCEAEWHNQTISTHALTWSATLSGGTTDANQKISTHALTWSATDRSSPA